MKLAIGLYGLYLLLVAIRANGSKFAQDLQQDAPGFLPWLIAAAVLGALYQWDKTRMFAALFVALAVITFVTKNFAQLKAQFAPIYNASLTPPAALGASPGNLSLTPLTVGPLSTSTSTQQLQSTTAVL